MPYDFVNCITHWEAYSRQSCYAAGQSSAERASDKDSLLRIVLQKLSLTDVTSCEITNVCKTVYTVHPVTFAPNPSRTHDIFFIFIRFTTIHYVVQKHLAYTTHKPRTLAQQLQLCIKHLFQMILFRTKIIPKTGRP